MANPQLENGHLAIANEIAEALMRTNLSPYESRVLWFVLRNTYGWKKKSDWFTLRQMANDIIMDRRLIHRTLYRLENRRIIVIRRDDKGRIYYGFQKNYELWRVSSVRMTPSSVEMTTVIRRDDGLSSVEMKPSTKETVTKETKVPTPAGVDIQLVEMLIAKMLENNPKSSVLRITPKQKASWINECRLMRERDGHSADEIKSVISFCQQDKFWKMNILSMGKLREKWDRLYMQNQEAHPRKPTYEELLEIGRAEVRRGPR